MSPHDEYFDHLTAHSLPPAVRVAEAMAPVDAVIIDVGANLGLCALPYALIAHSGRVIAVEPGHRTAQDLRSSLEFNGLTNVEVMEVALGAEAGTATLIDPTWNASGAFVSAGSSSVATVHEASPEVEATTIQVTTLDQLVNDRSLRRLDLLKIDVEGFESAVLAGGVRTLERFHPLSVIEFNPFTLSVMASGEPTALPGQDATSVSIRVRHRRLAQCRANRVRVGRVLCSSPMLQLRPDLRPDLCVGTHPRDAGPVGGAVHATLIRRLVAGCVAALTTSPA